MKLHLPKLLFIAVTGALATTEAAINYTTTSVSVNETEVISKHYDVGEAGKDISTVYSEGNSEIKNTFEMNNHDTMGIYTDANNKTYDTLKTHDFGKNYEGTLSGGSYTNEVTIGTSRTDYDLILNNDAVIALGGQYRPNSNQDKYVGIKAQDVTLNDSTTLIAGRATFSSLTVNDKATVTLHGVNAITQGSGATEYTGGNNMGTFLGMTWLNSYDKVTKIGSISVNDSAQVTLGVDNGQYGSGNKYKTNHWLNSLDGTINQQSAATKDAVYDENGVLIQEAIKESSLLIKGKTIFSGALNIEQSGGLMEIGLKEKDDNDSLVYLFSNSNNKITQTTGGTLRIGKMIKGTSSVEDSQIIVNQTGAGLIELKNGVEFKTGNNASSISQSGNGTINLSGNYTSALFNLSQEGNNGTINLGTMTESGVETKATMNASSLQQSAGNTFVITKNSSLTADNISIGGTLKNYGTIDGADSGDLLTVVGQGQLINEGTLNIDLCLESGTLTASHNSIFTNLMAQAGTININGAITINGSLELGQIASAYSLTKSTDKVTVNLTGDSSGIKLAEGATAVLGENVIFSVMVDSIDNMDTEKLLTVFTDAEGNEVDVDLDGATFMLKDRSNKTAIATYTDNGNGTVTLTVPEPTTATLSLLALAGLAARRRRK